MDGDDSGTTDDDAGDADARTERVAIYPDEGYVLAKIDRLKPPGEALVPLETHLKLTDISIAPATDFADYVVYDSAGRSYTRETLQATIDPPLPSRPPPSVTGRRQTTREHDATRTTDWRSSPRCTPTAVSRPSRYSPRNSTRLHWTSGR